MTETSSDKLSVVSLFSGIGGIDLGLQRAGFEIVAHSEVDEFANLVLTKNFPGVPNLGDVTKIDWTPWRGQVDVIAGGFPCQPFSTQGKRLGADDERNLWYEFARAIRDVRPHYVLLENVPGLLSSSGGADFGAILRDLASLGFDAEWDCVPASAFGAPHGRDRWFALAYPRGERQQEPGIGWPEPDDHAADDFREADDALDAFRRASLPLLCRRHDGLPRRMVKRRMTALGNAVVPAVAEHVGRILLQIHTERNTRG